ncbi:MAG: YiiX/YebB-like N1pC/P60 family cysteine hydrolase [Carboxydocellales bacterium]
MSLYKKIFAGCMLVILLGSTNSMVLASESNEPITKIKKNQIEFSKKSFTPSLEENIKNQDKKFSHVPKEMLGPKANMEQPKNRPVLPQGFKPGDAFSKTPTGTNDISFDLFEYGDFILVHDSTVAWGYFRHAGLWDTDFWNGNLTDDCIWEATPPQVTRGTPDKFRHYDQAVGLWVPSATYDERYQTTWYAYYQFGEPYEFNLYLNNEDTWYCSKLVWAAYKNKANIDLNNRYYAPEVFPDDLYNDDDAYLFAIGM